MASIHRKCETLFSRFATAIYDRKYLAFFSMLLLTVGLASQLGGITIDTRDESFFYEDDPTLVAYNDFRERFGQDDTFIIALKPQAGFNKDFFNFLYRLHQELEAAIPYLDEINSLINGRIVRGQADTLLVEDLMATPPRSDQEVSRILHLIERYPLYDNLLISKDRTIVSLLIKARAIHELPEEELLTGFTDDDQPLPDEGRKFLSNDESLEITRAIKSILVNYQGQGVDIYFSGTPAVIAELQMSIEHDLRIMLPLSFCLIVFFLALLFRRLSGVVYPLIVVFLSLLGALGIMAITGMPITLVTQILPSFLLVVGIADSVHILTIFYRLYRRDNNKQQAIIDAVGFAGLPVLMTSVTTACGLFSFVLADVATVGQLGLIAPAGVLLAFVYTVVLLPALIAIFPLKRVESQQKDTQPLADHLFSAITLLTTNRPVLVSVVSGLVVVVALYGAVSVRFSHNALTWFPEDSPVRVATDLLDTINGGSVMFEVVVDSGQENGLHNPDLLRRLDETATVIQNLEAGSIKAAKAWSLADVLKEINRALHEDRDEAYQVPDSQNLIAQELLLFESSGSEDLEDFTDPDYRLARLSAMTAFKDAVLYKDYVDQLREYLAGQFPDEKVVLTGKMPLFVEVIKNVITTLAKSYVFAIVVITLLMVLLVGRIRIGLMSMIANVVPIIAILGIMGMRKIPLDMSTSLIGSLVLGLIVDDTIHFLHHFRRAYEESGEIAAAVHETLATTGRAIFITSMVLAGGFFIYTTAYLESNVRYGLLSGCAVLFALVADFFLVPALLCLVYGRKNKTFSGSMARTP